MESDSNTRRSAAAQFQLVESPTSIPWPGERRVYFSGPLTWYRRNQDTRIDTVMEAATAVEQSLTPIGFDVHIPHYDADHVEQDRTYVVNRRRIARSSLVVAYYDHPSTGLGQELEMAAQYARPVILLVNTRRGTVSTMVTTAFFRAELLVFGDVSDIARQLPALATELAAQAPPPPLGLKIAPNLRAARRDQGLSRSELARAAGCTEELVRHIEEDDAHLVSLSSQQLQQLARVLQMPIAELLGLEDRRRAFERRVFELAATKGRSAGQALGVLELAARDAPSIDEIDDPTIENWLDVVESIASAPDGAG